MTQKPSDYGLYFSLVLISLSLAACGFQLRGTTGADSLPQRVFIADQVPLQQRSENPISVQLQQDLVVLELETFSAETSAMPGLILISERTQERSLSLDANLLNRLIEIGKVVDYQVTGSEGQILTIESIRVTRELTEDLTNPEAKQQERRQLLESINGEISRRLIRRLHNLHLKEQHSLEDAG